jgi:hypothetical protein
MISVVYSNIHGKTNTNFTQMPSEYEQEGTLHNWFYEDSITLVPNLTKTMKEKKQQKLFRTLSLMSRNQKKKKKKKNLNKMLAN